MENKDNITNISYTIEFILKSKNENSIIALSHIVEAYKSLYAKVSYVLNQEEKNVNQEGTNLNIDFSFNNNNRWTFIVKASQTDKTHSYMGNMLHLISLCLDEEKKEDFETICIPSIRYAFKKLFCTIIELDVSTVIVSMANMKIKLTETIINQFIDENNKNEECKMSANVQDGIKYLQCIFSQLSEYVGCAGTQSQFYENPKFIFRGITRFYPCKKENIDKINKALDEQKKRKQEESSAILSMKREINFVTKDLIRSSLSVRLRDTSKGLISNDAYIRSHYVNALEGLIQKAQNMYPGKYTSEMSNLDILADLQHNGGSTCLVDFSKNVLTSIWFACSTDREYNGYLYCYNIMEDMIKLDALTYIHPEDEKMKISELLAQTYRETNVCSDVETRFCLWEPSKKSNRIFRQDSVFVFGIEPFEVEKHSIKVIGIDSEWKHSILAALKAIFNISGSTVYNDYVGFATNTNKMRPYRKMGDTAYTRGYMNMIEGNYSSALDFLKLSELDIHNKEKWDEKRKLELYFSLAVCYKNLSRQSEEIQYLENANLEYKKVIDLANVLLKEKMPKLEKEEKRNLDYYRHKIIRAYNARVTLMYKLQRYNDAISICKEIIDTIKEWEKTMAETGKLLTSAYCKISILELRDLALVQNCNNKKEIDAQIKYVNNIYKEINGKEGKDGNNIQQVSDFNFFRLLNEYYDEVENVIKSKQYYEKKALKKIAEWNERAEKYFEKSKLENTKEKKKNNNYILWNFTDIKKAINSINQKDYLYNKKTILQDLTAGVISLRDLYEMHGWWSYDKI